MKKYFEVLDFFYLRTPLLPLDTISSLLECALNDEEKENAMIEEDLLEAQLTKVVHHLISYLDSPEIREAIYIGSPNLLDSFKNRYASSIPDDVSSRKKKKLRKDKVKLEHALLRYISRMSYRCTPYGLFAGCTLGNFGETTSIKLKKNEHHVRVARLDMEVLIRIGKELMNLAHIQSQLNYFPNSSLYKVPPNTLRYVEYRFKKEGEGRSYHLVSIEENEYVTNLLEKAKEGATIHALGIGLTSFDPEISKEEAEDFINELIQEQVLVSEFEPNLSGQDFLKEILQTLTKYKGTVEIQDWIKNIMRLLDSVNRFSPNENIEIYKQIQITLKQLNIPFKVNHVIQIDLFKKAAENQLSYRHKKNLHQLIKLYMHWARQAENTRINNFTEKFVRIYEDQMIPLVEALDPEFGICYETTTSKHQDNVPFLDGINMPNFRGQDLRNPAITEFSVFRRKKYVTFLQNQDNFLRIEEEELNDIPLETMHSPVSFNIMARLFVENNQEYFHVFAGGANSSATQLLGRFTAGDKELGQKLTSLHEKEAEVWNDAIIAEIIHLPEARVGNILFRDQLIDYEIPYLAKSLLPEAQQIPIDDLAICAKHGKLFLWSMSKQKRVIPKLSSAHNYSLNGLPIYLFLSDFGDQYSWSLSGGWNWGEFADQPYLPRIVYQNFILSPATWRLTSIDFKDNPNPSLLDMNNYICKLRSEQNLPRYVALADGDNELFMDIDNILFVRFLLHELIKRKVLSLKEILQTPDKLVVNGEDGRYTNELIFSVCRKNKYPIPKNILFKTTQIQRCFFPGTEWFYVKIYCGTKFSDHLITNVIRPLCFELLNRGIIENWFFIRYSDPDQHIRVRFSHSSSPNFYQIVHQELNKGCFEFMGNQIKKIVIDTYTRELERYGYDLIEVAERIFHFDSMATVDVLNMIHGDQGQQIRGLLAIKGVDLLLDALVGSLVNQETLIEQIRNSFFKEFMITQLKSLKENINKKYNQDKEQIYRILYDSDLYFPDLTHAINVFEHRSIQIKSLLLKYEIDTNADVWQNLIPSFLHMFLNRFFRTRQREQETIIYDFLYRAYKARRNRLIQMVRKS